MDITRLWAEANQQAAEAAERQAAPRPGAGGPRAPGPSASSSGKPRPALRALPPGRTADDLCPACRRNGRVYCPHKPLMAIRAELAAPLAKQDFFGPSPPNLFVGQYGWPSVNWGPMVGLASGIPDNPKDWYGWGFDQIVRARSMQVRGQAKDEVSAAARAPSPGLGRDPAAPRMLRDAQEAAMSFAPIDLELRLSKVPTLAVEFHAVHQPMGPSAPMEKLTLADNSRIPSKVDELVEEGVRAQAALAELAGAGFDEHYLTRLLTAGVLGRPARRTLVPTRWGITAVDDTLAKGHLARIRDLPSGGDYLLFFNEYLANRFSVLLQPGAWEYEGFETWCGPMVCPNATPVHLDAGSGPAPALSPAPPAAASPSPTSHLAPVSGPSPKPRFPSFAISEEYEPHEGRTTYAKKQGGGYYAARLGVAEAMATRLGRQYRALVIREIMPEYDLPVGVWEIRENVRHAMQNPPQRFDTLEAAQAALAGQLQIPLGEYRQRSRLLTQRRLPEF